MILPQTAERAFTRYADTLYRAALLRDPDPRRAADAVGTAFARLDWSVVALDDELEARLIQALPPVPRFRWRRGRRLLPLPAVFWKLPAHARLALGLRLLRGMSSERIARSIGRPLSETQVMLVEGVAAMGSAPLKITGDCRACLIARLDNPAGGQPHAAYCRACGAAL